ncbi:MAG TPA: hypothetical protein VJZ78_02755 [Anaerolineales bacterium]|nr:hypothetical protein [Anaerolineales bacterium]
MFKLVNYQQKLLWLTKNSGTIIRVLILLVVITAALINPDIVLADPVMGGSVGRSLNSFWFWKNMTEFMSQNLP